MTHKHTPGPWEAWTFMVKGGHHMRDTICHVGSSTSLPPSRSNESVANARLIAAAPDLLAAGQAMVDDYQTSTEHHPDHVLITRTAFEAMQAAIAKATEPTT